MKTITFSSIKGGTGKTSIAILAGNLLARSGLRVLMLDLDIQNSLSFYYLADPGEAGEKNIARALLARDLPANILDSGYSEKLKIVPSALELVDLRALNEKTLNRLIPQVEDDFDICIIDTAPSYDNLVLNGLQAADLIISPCRLSGFDYKGLHFLKGKIAEDLAGGDHWNILINFYRQPRGSREDNPTRQYLSLFRESFPNTLPFEIPESTLIRKAVDTREIISQAATKQRVFGAIVQLAGFMAEKELVLKGGF